MVVSGLVSGFSYGSLGDPGLSLIPVLSIICCGGSLSFSLIGYKRYKAAQELEACSAGRTASSQKLIKRLIETKGVQNPI